MSNAHFSVTPYLANSFTGQLLLFIFEKKHMGSVISSLSLALVLNDSSGRPKSRDTCLSSSSYKERPRPCPRLGLIYPRFQ